ncbi:hypothetical protein FBULB1_7917 [Fusarium bulbicola]|nr:hypothetical protein FBULB1_7917 [Fusarium bulbicola]
MNNNKTAAGDSRTNGVKRSRNDPGSPSRSSPAADTMLQVQNRSRAVFEALKSNRLAFETTSIETEFNGLYLGVYDTAGGICDLSSSDDLPKQLPDISELSDMWARRVGGTGFSNLVASAKKVKTAKMQLVASTLTAGVFDLVFQSTFPDILAIESPMLAEYRKVVAGLGGRELLLKIDRAAIKSLFSDPNSLQYFIPLESRSITQRPQSSLTETEDMALTSLESHLSEALSIKLELVLSVKRFQYFFFKPGTLFDAESMQPDMLQDKDSMTKNNGLEICVFPALFSVPEGDGDKEEEIERSFGVNHQGLLEARVEDLKSLVLVAKARVLL